jgi:uncharacterized protein YcbX
MPDIYIEYLYDSSRDVRMWNSHLNDDAKGDEIHSPVENYFRDMRRWRMP